MKIKILTLCFFCFTIAAYEFDEQASFGIFARNCGGNYKLLDYVELYEIDSNYHYAVQGETEEEILSQMISKVSDFEFARGSLYKIWLEKFFTPEKIRFIRGVNFGEFEDEDFGFIKWHGCSVIPFAKVVDIENEGKSIFIDLGIWEKLSNQDKVGAKINFLLNLEHILIKRSSNKNTNTLNTRYVNAILASNKHENDLLFKFKFNLYKLLKFSTIRYNGVFFDLTTDDSYLENDRDLYGWTYAEDKFFKELNLDSSHKFINAPLLKIHFDRKLITNKWKYDSIYGEISGCLAGYEISSKSTHTEYKYLNGDFTLVRITSADYLHNGKRFDFKYIDGKIQIVYLPPTYARSDEARELEPCKDQN